MPRRAQHQQGPWEDEVLPYVLGELTGEQRMRFETALQESDLCRRQVAEAEKLVAELRAVPSETLSRDLSREIIEKIRSGETHAALPILRVGWAIAASVVVLLGGLLAVRLLRVAPSGQGPVVAQTETDEAIRRGLAWLTELQEPAGGWDVESLGGKPLYTTALNGLAVLAIARNPVESAAQKKALDRAAGFLVAQQDDTGRLGPEGSGMMYNHGIATVALSEVYRATGEERYRAPLAAALAFIQRQQHKTGGWGYSRTPGARPNTSVSVWQIQALLSGVRLGWDEYRDDVREGLAWLHGVTDQSGFFGYEQSGDHPYGESALTSMGAYCVLAAQREGVRVHPRFVAKARKGLSQTLPPGEPSDYYRDFFRTAALRELDDEQFAAALEDLEEAILALQVQASDRQAGSWQPNDRWGDVGGRLYSTAMAMLSLRNEAERPPAL